MNQNELSVFRVTWWISIEIFSNTYHNIMISIIRLMLASLGKSAHSLQCKLGFHPILCNAVPVPSLFYCMGVMMHCYDCTTYLPCWYHTAVMLEESINKGKLWNSAVLWCIPVLIAVLLWSVSWKRWFS